MALPIALDLQELPASIATLYTAGYAVELTDITLSNRTAGPLTATIHIVPPGGTAGEATKLLPAITVDGNDFRAIPNLNFIIKRGSLIRGLASGAGINFTAALRPIPQ